MSVTAATIDAILSDLSARASGDRDIPVDVTVAAAAATSRAFPQFRGRVLAIGERRRVSAYFDAVVRRRVIRSRDGRRAASRAVLSAVVADLRAVGCDAARIAYELERGWRGQVPDEVLEEMTLSLVS